MAGFLVSFDPAAVDPRVLVQAFGCSPSELGRLEMDGCCAWHTPELPVGMSAFALARDGGFLCGYGDRFASVPLDAIGEGAGVARQWCGASFLRSCGVLCTEGEAEFWTDEMAACPLFWALLPSGAPIFASEAKLLLPFLGARALLTDFAGRPLPLFGNTVFAGVRAALPGTTWRMRRRFGWRLESGGSYFKLPPASTWTDLNEANTAVADALEEAVTRVVDGLREVSVTLSGGVDSSMVAALARRRVEAVHSYTVGTPYGDEFEAAREVADHLGTHHRELLMTADDLRELLPRMVWLMETWDPLTLQIAAPVAFLYQRLAAQTPSVFLTGYGADLIFAGVVDPSLEEPVLETVVRNQVRLTVPTNELSPAFAARCGITVRYPYWSPRVLSVGLNIRGRLKLREGHVKYVLRRAAERFLPYQVAWRPKLGIHEGSAVHHLFAEVLGECDLRAQRGRLREIAEEVFATARFFRSGPSPWIPADAMWRKEPCASC